MNDDPNMTYEFDAQAYRDASETQQQWGSELIEELKLQGHEHILDLGCGDGRLSAALAQRAPQGTVLGIDASTNMIALAQASFSLPNLSFVHRDMMTLNDASHFDVVYSNAALHWVHDHERLLQKVHRALRPQGRMHASFASDRNCLHFKQSLRETMADPRFATALEDFPWPWFMPSAAKYESIVAAIGFAETRTWIQPNDKTFKNADDLTAWLMNPCLIPFRNHLPPDLGQAFSDSVRARMLSRTKQPDGCYNEIFNRLRFYGKKCNG
jgi:trans-aconitate 2-methyltransferase